MTSKKIFFFISFSSGVLGGLFIFLIFPYLANVPPLNKIDYFKSIFNVTTIINPTERVFIEENKMVEEAIKKISLSMVSVEAKKSERSETAKSAPKISFATGLIVTSDGQIMIPGDLVSKGYVFLVGRNGNHYDAELVKQDEKNNLAIIKIAENNLPAVSFADTNNLNLGQAVVEAKINRNKENTFVQVDFGVISAISEKDISLNKFSQEASISGTALINIKAEVIGVYVSDKVSLGAVLMGAQTINDLIRQ